MNQNEDKDRLIALSSLSRSAGNTGWPDVLQLAKGWLRLCLESHDECPSHTIPARLPRRLLALSGRRAKLIDTTGQTVSVSYATLSHCWGGMPSFLLTSQTMNNLQEGLAFSDFDPTFHDAMLTTQALGTDYLWIDCYCIIQGTDNASRKDWLEQSVLMHEIYANGIINIGAA
ncbi:hypothetical protein M409DRAFT_37814, partial [Zasmidium cellare ATCC 36951]